MNLALASMLSYSECRERCGRCLEYGCKESGCFGAGKTYFSGRTLKETVLLTARHRGRILESDAFMRIGEFAEDPFMKTQWIRFEPAKEAGLEFPEVLHRLDQFLYPIYDAILKGEEFDRQWSCSQKAWE